MNKEQLIGALLASAMGDRDHNEAERPHFPPEVDAERLRALYATLTTAYTFAPGDLVTWKPGLDVMHKPAVGHPAIVTRVLDAPRRRIGHAQVRCAVRHRSGRPRR
jgi:hypothetical protein